MHGVGRRCSGGHRGLDDSFKAKECMCSCPPAGLTLLLGWETRVAAIGVGKRDTGLKECLIDCTGHMADFTKQHNEEYGVHSTPWAMKNPCIAMVHTEYSITRSSIRSALMKWQQQLLMLLHTTTQTRPCLICLKSRAQL